MSKYNKQSNEEQSTWKPSAKEAKELGEALKAYSPRIIGKRKIYPFQLYLESKGIVRFDGKGEMLVSSPSEFWKQNEINSLYEYIRDAELKSILEQYPEEKAAHQKKVGAIFKEMREMLKNLTLTP